MVSVSPPTADFLSCIKIVQPHLVCSDSGLWTQTEDFLLLKHNKSPRLEAGEDSFPGFYGDVSLLDIKGSENMTFVCC